ncbi:MAG: ABC transporter permease [Anaerolineales bacterium]|nr:ABC transporter permease [Anaerolineales bacterium]MBS3753178.1 ABC transporter permease [Anaerolineales bacterium]
MPQRITSPPPDHKEPITQPDPPEPGSLLGNLRIRLPFGKRLNTIRGHLTLNFWIGAGITTIVFFTALFAPLLSPYPPREIRASDRLQPPSSAHPFGTDALGRDLFSRVVYGARIGIAMSALSVAISALIGVALGFTAGYYGGIVDHLLSRLMEVWLAFPSLLLAIVIVARLGPSMRNTALALGFMGVTGFYRLTRGETLSSQEETYVEAAEAMGAGDIRIIFRYILPNFISSLIVLGTLRLGTMLLAVGGLSFIGLGTQPPQPEWGALLANGRDYLNIAPWLAIFPGACITIAVMGINLLGDGLRDALNPPH